MSALRSLHVYTFGAAAAVVALFGATVFAQETEDEQENSAEEIEEIVVVAPKPGGRKRVDDIYIDPVRARVLKDLNELKKDQEEYEWRTAKVVIDPPRIKWGYDPTDDYHMRNSMSLEDEAWGKTKPATLFRVGF
jgi:hypothetical protein